MSRFRLVVLSVVLTSAFWLAVGTWWSMRQPAADDAHRWFGEATGPAVKTTGAPLAPNRPPSPGSVDSLLLIPVAGVRADDLIDSFARTRGIDIPAPLNMPVIAAAPGIVEKLGGSGSSGRMIDIRSPDRTRLYRYAHLGGFAPGLSEGQVIGAGEQLGLVGSAGKTDGKPARLHFEVLAIMPDRDWPADTRPLNPYPLLGGR